MAVKAILATGMNGELGVDGKLPWDCPEDLKYFKKMTEGGCVLMGRKTFESLPFENGLPNRKNLVLSKTPKNSFISQDVVWLTSPQSLRGLVGTVVFPFNDVWVMGGASVYKEMLPYVNEIHHTTIKGNFPEADIFMDMKFLGNGEWKLYSVEQLSKDATVRVWKRKEN